MYSPPKQHLQGSSTRVLTQKVPSKCVCAQEPVGKREGEGEEKGEGEREGREKGRGGRRGGEGREEGTKGGSVHTSDSSLCLANLKIR